MGEKEKTPKKILSGDETLPDGWPVYIDSRVAALPSVVVGGGNRSSKLRLSPAELLRIPGAAVVEGLALDREGPP